jgi:hypothetical protein
MRADPRFCARSIPAILRGCDGTVGPAERAVPVMSGAASQTPGSRLGQLPPAAAGPLRLGAPIDPGHGVAPRHAFGMDVQTFGCVDGVTPYDTKPVAQLTS